MQAKYLVGLSLVLLLGFQDLKAQNFYKEKIARETYIQAGIGPSFMYADNAGALRNVDFNIRPSFSASIARNIHPFINMRGSVGYQFYKSRPTDYFESDQIQKWATQNEAVNAQSNIIFMDIMPMAHVNRVTNHINRGNFDFYGGAGLGMLMAIGKETKLKDTGLYEENKTRVVPYIPLRVGFGFKLDIYSDIAVEGTMMLTFSDKIDGATGRNRYNDHPLQGQIVYRRYLSPVRNLN